MVKNRQDSREIPEVIYRAPVGAPSGLEVVSLAALRSRGLPDLLSRTQRAGFHHLIAVDSGVLRHSVDFVDYVLEPGSLFWVRPGQVQRWGDLGGAEGSLVFFESDFPGPATIASAHVDGRFGPTLWRPVDADRRAVDEALRHLVNEFSEGGLPPDVRQVVLRHLLDVVLLRFAHCAVPVGTPDPEPNDTFTLFREAIERGFTRSRQVDDYARDLGYSARTLSRATLAYAGVGAKEFIDRRVVLEAKRLLAYGDWPVAQIARHLGFSDAANFGTYFHRRAGATPAAFRTSFHRGGRPTGNP